MTCFSHPPSGNALEFLDETYTAKKLEGWMEIFMVNIANS